MRDDEVQNPAFLRGDDDDIDAFTEEVRRFSNLFAYTLFRMFITHMN